jgi:hypothetical protein
VASSTLVLLRHPEQSPFGVHVLSSVQNSLPPSAWHPSAEGAEEHSWVALFDWVLPAHSEQSPLGLQVLSTSQYSLPPSAWQISADATAGVSMQVFPLPAVVLPEHWLHEDLQQAAM